MPPLRSIVQLAPHQCGIVKRCSTTDAIHTVRIMMERSLEKQCELHVAFLDLEKAFDRVPHHLIWWALRKHDVPEEYVRWIRIIYKGATSHVRTAAGRSDDFQINVGVHQGSVLSPLLFITVVDTIINTSYAHSHGPSCTQMM